MPKLAPPRLAKRPVSRGIEFHAVTPERLADLRRFSERHGKFRYCSCMRWRLASADYRGAGSDERAAALEKLVRARTPVGVLGYLGGEPVGWCSIAPRDTYGALATSRSIQLPPHDGPVWSVVCFFLAPGVRGTGFRARLLQAAIDFARSRGAAAVEAYPAEDGSASYGYMGTLKLFRAAGFQEVAKIGAPGATPRRVVRYATDVGRSSASVKSSGRVPRRSATSP